MINFNCKKCGKAFSVSEKVAGKKGKCKACGTLMIIPNASLPPSEKIVINFDTPIQPPPKIVSKPTKPTPAPPRKLSMRMRRLTSDAKQVQQAFKDFPLIRVQPQGGEPPEKYRIEYHVRGLVRGHDGSPTYRENHLVEIQLTREYPRQSPKCKMLTPIFHPNIEPAVICIGDHWTAGERLADLIIRIGEIICFQAHNIQSPLDGEAAMWTDQNLNLLPIDSRSLRPPGYD